MGFLSNNEYADNFLKGGGGERVCPILSLSGRFPCEELFAT